jgi:L-ribulose-5-phosphate 3-epimerase
MVQESRRTFLKGAAALGAASLGLSRSGHGAEMPFQISLAEWSLHRALFAGDLDHLDFPRVARQDYGVEAVEYVNQFFMDKGADRAYLQEMKSRAEGEGVRSVLIMCDREGRLGDPDDAARTQSVENHVKWLDAAVFLGCHSIRVNAASEGSREEQARLAADGLRRLAELGAERELNVIVENHGGLSSDASWLTEVMRTVDHPRCGTLPDFGNFRISEDESYDIYQGVTEMMPFAKAVSAKSYGFDADGNETRIDYERMMRIVLDAGYRGHVGVEFEGRELDEPAGIRATIALLRRVGEKVAPEY